MTVHGPLNGVADHAPDNAFPEAAPFTVPMQPAADDALDALGERPLGTVGIIGLGYVGLPTAIAFANAGHTVIGCDVSEGRLADIKADRADLLELDRAHLANHLDSDALRLTTDHTALAAADLVVVCVPTPIDHHLVPDLTALRAACASAVAIARPGQTIVLTSTTYVGSTREMVAEPLAERGLRVGEDVFVAFSPERIDPGNRVHRHDTVPRVVGGITDACRDKAAAALRRVTTKVHEVGSADAAEAAKLLENTFRAVNIAFVNEFADACGELGLDVMEVIEAAATKPYGFMPFYPGPGVGGHCVPCDPHYLLWQLRAQRTGMPLTESAMTAIAQRPRKVSARARELLLEAGRRPTGARVLVVGLTYKPGVQDVRESPALEIVDELARGGARVDYYDPLIPRMDERVSVVHPAEEQWDLVVLHTLHPGVDYSWVESCPAVLDATYRAGHLPNRAVI
jgi:UDP-N-acetyl-D-glucosamine dehydrogenase